MKEGSDRLEYKVAAGQRKRGSLKWSCEVREMKERATIEKLFSNIY